jgi:hypothetical protein
MRSALLMPGADGTINLMPGADGTINFRLAQVVARGPINKPISFSRNAAIAGSSSAPVATASPAPAPTVEKQMWEPIKMALDVERVVNGTFTVAHAKSLLSFLPVGLPVTLDPLAKIDLDKSLTYYIKRVTADQIELAYDIKLSKPVVLDSSVPFAILYEHFIDNLSIIKTGHSSDVSIFQTSSEFSHSRTGLVPGTPIEFVEDVQGKGNMCNAVLKNTTYIVKNILTEKAFTIASVKPADPSEPHDGLIAGDTVRGVAHNLPKLPRMLVRKAIAPKWHAAKIASLNPSAAATSRPPLGLTLVPAQSKFLLTPSTRSQMEVKTGAKIASVVPNGLAASTGTHLFLR